MILPEGASCEDLANPSILYPYLKRHATEWYRHIRIEEQYETSNGSLYLITGCDRPTSRRATWASIPARYSGQSLPSPHIDIRYRYEDSRASITGQDDSNIKLYHHPRESRVAVFIRGIRIAVNAVSWPQTNDPFDSSREYYRSLATPTVGRYAKVLQLRDRHFKIPENPKIEGILVSSVDYGTRLTLTCPIERVSPVQCYISYSASNGMFYSLSSLPIVLRTLQRPAARLAVVDDATWMSVAHGVKMTVMSIFV